MIKALFMDYTGTIVQEGGKDLRELVRRVCTNSELHEPEKAVQLWWSLVKEYEDRCYGESYLSEDEIVERILARLQQTIGLRDNPEELHELVQSFWIYAPLFPDAGEFLAECPLPVYIISNNRLSYLEKAMEDKSLSPAGIVCADMARAYKPHRELFQKALEVSGCQADEVIHIGDSYESDVCGALAAGIRPVLLRRTGDCCYDNITVIRSLQMMDNSFLPLT